MLAISLLLGFEWNAISHIYAKKKENACNCIHLKFFHSDSYKHGKTQNFRPVLI